MNRKATIFLRGVFAALALSAVFSASASAAPAWRFNGTELTGSEVILGAAIDSSMTIPGLTTKCENFLYKLSISNSAGTGKGEVTELPLYNCTTTSKYCTVKTIGAESLPWPSNLKTVSSNPYIIVEGVKVGIVYSGELCSVSGLLVSVKGTAGGLISNVTETATFNKASFTATGTKLTALGSEIEWNGVFPTEAFQWKREQALSVS